MKKMDLRYKLPIHQVSVGTCFHSLVTEPANEEYVVVCWEKVSAQ